MFCNNFWVILIIIFCIVDDADLKREQSKSALQKAISSYQDAVQQQIEHPEILSNAAHVQNSANELNKVLSELDDPIRKQSSGRAVKVKRAASTVEKVSKALNNKDNSLASDLIDSLERQCGSIVNSIGSY